MFKYLAPFEDKGFYMVYVLLKEIVFTVFFFYGNFDAKSPEKTISISI